MSLRVGVSPSHILNLVTERGVGLHIALEFMLLYLAAVINSYDNLTILLGRPITDPHACKINYFIQLLKLVITF